MRICGSLGVSVCVCVCVYLCKCMRVCMYTYVCVCVQLVCARCSDAGVPHENRRARDTYTIAMATSYHVILHGTTSHIIIIIMMMMMIIIIIIIINMIIMRSSRCSAGDGARARPPLQRPGPRCGRRGIWATVPHSDTFDIA